MADDREARAKAIADEARRARKPLPRGLWIVAALVAIVCAGALAYAWFAERDTVADRHFTSAPNAGGSSGLALGLIVGIGVGIVIGSLLAVRRR